MQRHFFPKFFSLSTSTKWPEMKKWQLKGNEEQKRPCMFQWLVVFISKGFQHWFLFFVGTPWMRRGFFFFFIGGFALQSSLYSASSQPNWYKTDSVKNPAGARILNSREKEGYWKHHCFITMFCYEICFELIKQYRNLLFQEPMRFWLHITKDLTKLRRRRPKSNRFNDQNNN